MSPRNDIKYHKLIIMQRAYLLLSSKYQNNHVALLLSHSNQPDKYMVISATNIWWIFFELSKTEKNAELKRASQISQVSFS